MGQSLNKDITDHAWTPENPYNSKYPRLRNNANSKNNIASDALVFNASYLRCKNIQLGYHASQAYFGEIFCRKSQNIYQYRQLVYLNGFPRPGPGNSRRRRLSSVEAIFSRNQCHILKFSTNERTLYFFRSFRYRFIAPRV